MNNDRTNNLQKEESLLSWVKFRLTVPSYVLTLSSLIGIFLVIFFQSRQNLESKLSFANDMSTNYSLALLQKNRMLLESLSGIAINSKSFKLVCIVENDEVIYSMPSSIREQCLSSEVSDSDFRHVKVLKSIPQYKAVFVFPKFSLSQSNMAFITMFGIALVLVLYLVFLVRSKISSDIIKPLQENLDSIRSSEEDDGQYQRKKLKIAELNHLFDFFASKIDDVKSLSKKQAEEAKAYARDKAIAQTTQMIAHDLKGPMAVFHKVAFGGVSEFQEEQGNMKNALHRVLSMTDSIKSADIEGIVKPTSCDLDLSEVIHNTKAFAASHSVDVIDRSTKVENVIIDLPKVERCVSNLLINAVEAAKATVYLDCHLQPDGALCIEVTDDGDGVPNEMQARLFKMGATFGKDNGTGLGLAFVKQVAMGHGGDSHYCRTDGLSRFSIVLKDVSLVSPSPVSGDVVAVANDITQLDLTHIVIKISDSSLESSVIDLLEKRYPKYVITNDLSDIERSRLVYSNDSSVLLLDCAEEAKILITNRLEDQDRILNRIAIGLGSI